MKFFKSVLMTGLSLNDPVVCKAQDRTSAYNQFKKLHPGRVVSLDMLIEISEEEYNNLLTR